VLLLPEVLDVSNARRTLHMLLQALERVTEPSVVVEASVLKRFDSAALAVLLECRRHAQACGKGFELKDAPPRLLQLASLQGVAQLLPARSTETPAT